MNSELKRSPQVGVQTTVGVLLTRDLVFVSHATPEDNEFARWFTLQLNRRGFKAWCDLTKLLGGEKWWADINEAISLYSSKFLFVASRTSVKKPGVIRELKVALQTAKDLQRFIIPILGIFVGDLRWITRSTVPKSYQPAAIIAIYGNRDLGIVTAACTLRTLK
jgi:hypothetical protein